MAKANFKVFDSDMHCVEPVDLWQRYIDPKYRERAPVGSDFAFRNAVVYTELEGHIMPWFAPRGPDGKPLPKYMPDARMREAVRRTMEQQPDILAIERLQQTRFADMAQRGWTASTQLEAMDREGVDLTVVYPTSGLLVLGLDDLEPGLAGAIARAYNDWLYDYIGTNTRRLLGAAMVAPHDVAGAVTEARRAVLELGFKAVFLRPNPVQGRNWYDPCYEPLWHTLEELNVPLVFHEGVGTHLHQAGERFGSNIFLRHVACHPMEMMYAVMALCGGGVLARHPRLRVGFFEGNCGWVPWLLDRLDDHYEIQLGIDRKKLPEKPSDYFKRQCVVSMEAEEGFARQVIEVLGDDNLVFSTDWPHPDSKYPHGTDTFLKLPLGEASKARILWDNCQRFYAIEG